MSLGEATSSLPGFLGPFPALKPFRFFLLLVSTEEVKGGAETFSLIAGSIRGWICSAPPSPGLFQSFLSSSPWVYRTGRAWLRVTARASWRKRLAQVA